MMVLTGRFGFYNVEYEHILNKNNCSMENLRKQIESLKSKEHHLDEQIKNLREEGFKEEELNMHIEKLHEYNEVKDIAQLILGKLAIFEGVTIKEMHEKYGLNPED
ncbi:DNA repair protein SWI5 homolog isoform X3 [Centruroides vittatus]|uniref:DNA repair protein SWI5 homolog isoform X3 n=1 Tax=Centruroides vittatus TaxID=120091 RepID=UPI0035101AEF